MGGRKRGREAHREGGREGARKVGRDGGTEEEGRKERRAVYTCVIIFHLLPDSFAFCSILC